MAAFGTYGAGMTPTPITDRLLTPRQVADLLQVTPRALREWRRIGYGPAWFPMTSQSPRYRASAVAAFLAERESVDRPTAS